MRELLAEAHEHDDRRARLAIEIFCYRARKYIGSYLAAMNGTEAIVFTGGIGENSAEIRARICSDLAWLGVERMERIPMIAYRGPTLIAEPELRWPVLILAAFITALLAVSTAGLYYMAMTHSGVSSHTEPRLEGALQPGQTEFERFRQHIAIEQLVGTEKVHPFDTVAVAITATVRNNTGRTISQ